MWVGWPFHTELGTGNPLSFLSASSSSSKNRKGKVHTLGSNSCTPSTYLTALILSTGNQNSNLSSPAQESQQEETRESIILEGQTSSACYIQGRLGMKEAPIILPGWTESPENDQIRGCHFILQIGFWLLGSLDFLQGWGVFLDLYQ